MDPTTRLLSLSFAMLIGCYVFGSIPLTFSLTEKNLRLVSIVGGGLVVGTALSVIIPEGIHSLYENQVADSSTHHDHKHLHSRDTQQTLPGEKAKEEPLWGIGFQEKLPELELHSMIGLSLSFGFIFMLLIDHLCGGGHSHGSGNDERRPKSMTATIGLLVHAAADGIALGAAASTTRTDVEMIVFVAIMLHKAPAAFGLTSFLLHESLDRGRIRKHLLAFSAAAPFCAIITYFGLSQTGKKHFTSMNGTGYAMLFSAGTFLYVATVHILPELLEQKSNDNNIGAHDRKTLTKKELFYLILGIVLPLVLGIYHHH